MMLLANPLESRVKNVHTKNLNLRAMRKSNLTVIRQKKKKIKKT